MCCGAGAAKVRVAPEPIAGAAVLKAASVPVGSFRKASKKNLVL